MEQLISKLVIMEVGKCMDKSRQELAMSDETYQIDCRDEKELEARYEALNLAREQRMLINDYISCLKSANSRYSELSYIAGVLDTVRVLTYLGLLKNATVPATQNK